MKKWQPRQTAERSYERAIRDLMKGLFREIKNLDSPFLIQQAVTKFARSPTFQWAAKRVAYAMIRQVDKHQYRTWKEAARGSQKGRLMAEILQRQHLNSEIVQEILRRNTELIQSLPEKLAQQAVNRAAREQARGNRSDAIVEEFLEKWPQLTKSRAKLIARTEMSKASTAMTRLNATNAGLEWYVWRTSKDARVRSSHQHMEDVLVAWDESPSPEELDGKAAYGHYHAGDTFNCRCYPEPLVDYNDVSWPHKVYHNGKIRHMTLAQFKRINQMI